MIPTPAHGCYPAAHAAEAFVVSTLLRQLLEAAWGAPSASAKPSRLELYRTLDRMAGRIAANRVVAGVHFPVDNLAGAALGQSFGEHLAARAKGAAAVHGAVVDGRGVRSEDFHVDLILGGADWRRLPIGGRLGLHGIAYPKGPITTLNWLWEQAVQELASFRDA